MSPEELHDHLHQKPFQPFRIVLTDGMSHDVRHPDLLWVGQRTAFVGFTGDAAQTLFERSVQVDLLHITRIEPLEFTTHPPMNGSTRQ